MEEEDRTKSDLVVRKTTNEPLISQGPVGRQAWNGRTATVFGATGFLGRYVVSKLAREGTKVIVPYRGLKEHTRHLIPQGDLGMVTQIECDLRIPRQLEEAMIHSDLVINLAGRNYETKNFTLEKVHIQGAMDIATTAQELGVARFIHVSRLGADASSPSEILSCKAKGEHMVRECYPDATIVRPAAMYGLGIFAVERESQCCAYPQANIATCGPVVGYSAVPLHQPSRG
ncbi:NADH-ubiquinone oxidoreductase 40 kDa subunit, mitochondrial [Zancudomyces culisetae]|uniref:NADH-ubiquinone oxidoreductase 40 kDa subunit, mitochondrial n=1 Tax=Zancudomyces culisetae TaxID=1213189 RepID=A0A1R1PS24_ZANCU|nr:NADH-ubiquinone oxidoreductase 40 kDa subunit, mitochondrial [Zancudomyces culisetae]|eukprot:OMH83786.1 NADH-ubiquinone oxidoreductase 40 kDa subunit, mitochondrial [Zancudomyces culisetae]